MWRAYLPHAGRVLTPSVIRKGLEEFEDCLPLLQKVGLCLLGDGRYDESAGK